MITKIEIDRILDFYDVPQLFLGRDIIGTRYLCLLYDDSEYCKYIAIRISIDRLRAFFAKGFDLRSLLMSPEIDDEYYIVSYYDDFYHIEKYNNFGALPEAMLPEEGYFFEGGNDDASIMCEAIEFNHPVIHLGFEDVQNSHSIPVSTLSVLTTQYQSMVANCYKKIDGTKDDRDFRLRIFAYSAASFNVHMYAESDLDLFGSSRIDKTLHKLDSLLKCTTDEQLREFLIPLKGHTIRSYKNFIKELISNKIAVKYKWVSSIAEGKIVANKVGLPKLEQIYEVLSESSEFEKEEKTFEGYLTGFWMSSCKWSLKTDSGEEVSGKAKSPDLLFGLVSGEVRYKITCEEILEQNNVSSKEKVTLILINIEEIGTKE